MTMWRGTGRKTAAIGLAGGLLFAGSIFGAASAGAAPTVTRSTLTFAEPFAQSSTADFVNASGKILGQGNLAGLSPQGNYWLPFWGTTNRAIAWNGTTPTDINPGLSILSVPISLSDDGTMVGLDFDNSDFHYFVRVNGVTTEFPWGTDASAVSSNGMVAVVYPTTINNIPVTAVGAWKGGKITLLAPLPSTSSAPLPQYETDGVYSINAAGVAVGAGSAGAVAWTGGNEVSLPALAGTQGTSATHIDDQGRIWGTSGDRSVVWQGSVKNGSWSGTVTALPFLPGGKTAGMTWMNAAGTAVGWATDASGTEHAVKWPTLTSTPVLLPTAGTPSASAWSAAVKINSSGEIIGNDSTGPVVWQGNTVVHVLAGTTLVAGTLNDLNDTGTIVGSASTTSGGPTKAYSWKVTS